MSIRAASPTDDRGVPTLGSPAHKSEYDPIGTAAVRIVQASAEVHECARQSLDKIRYFLTTLPAHGADKEDYEKVALRLGSYIEPHLATLPDLSHMPASRAINFHVSPALGELPVELMPYNGRPVCLKRPVNRLLSSHRARPLLPRQRWKVLVASAHQPRPTLPWLDAEHKSLSKLFRQYQGEQDIELASWSAVGNTVSSLISAIEWADVVHISGHVIPSETVDGTASIQLDGNNPLHLTAASLSQLKSPPRLFWVNGCSSGRCDVGQIARALTDAGCTHVIGSLQPIGDGPAGLISPEFYKRLLSGGEVGQACLSLRQMLYEQADPAWWSLVHYGLPGRIFNR